MLWKLAMRRRLELENDAIIDAGLWGIRLEYNGAVKLFKKLPSVGEIYRELAA